MDVGREEVKDCLQSILKEQKVVVVDQAKNSVFMNSNIMKIFVSYRLRLATRADCQVHSVIFPNHNESTIMSKPQKTEDIDSS